MWCPFLVQLQKKDEGKYYVNLIFQKAQQISIKYTTNILERKQMNCLILVWYWNDIYPISSMFCWIYQTWSSTKWPKKQLGFIASSFANGVNDKDTAPLLCLQEACAWNAWSSRHWEHRRVEVAERTLSTRSLLDMLL